MTETTVLKTHGQIAFEAYNESRGGKTHDGKPTPPWESLGEGVQKGWETAAFAVLKGRGALKKGEMFNFSTALQMLKDGHRLARAGWNGKQMWIALTPGSIIPLAQARNEGAVNHLRREKLEYTEDSALVEHIKINGHIDMRAADGSLVVGWLASQTDLLAEDWMILG